VGAYFERLLMRDDCSGNTLRSFRATTTTSLSKATSSGAKDAGDEGTASVERLILRDRDSD